MKNECEDILAKFLKPNEKLLWCGKPKVDYLLKFSEIVIELLIGVFLAIFAIIIDIIEIPKRPSALLFAVLFVIWILWSIFNYFIIKPKLLRNTTYGLTNQRIMILNNYKKEKLETFDLKEITKIKFQSNKNGVGNIEYRKYSRSLIFKYIENAENVYKQIQDI